MLSLYPENTKSSFAGKHHFLFGNIVPHESPLFSVKENCVFIKSYYSMHWPLILHTHTHTPPYIYPIQPFTHSHRVMNITSVYWMHQMIECIINCEKKNKLSGAGEKTRYLLPNLITWVKAPGSIHTVQGEYELQWVVPWLPHESHVTHIHIHTKLIN